MVKSSIRYLSTRHDMSKQGWYLGTTVAFSAAVEVPAILPPVVLCLSQSRLKPGSSSLQKNIPDHLTLLIFRHIPTLMLL